MAAAEVRTPVPEEKEEDKKEEKDGMVYMWQGYHGNVEVVKFPVLSNKTIRRVAIGAEHSIFCTDGGEVFACGSNRNGQLGIEDTTSDYVMDPVMIQGLQGHKVLEVACGVSHSAAVTDQGLCFCWGLNSSFQCGQTNENVNTPSEVLILTESGDPCAHGVCTTKKVSVRQVACGWSHTLVLSSEGELWGWGNGEGLGVESVKDTAKPILLETFVGRNVLSISCGHFHTLALLEKSPLSDVPSSPVKTKSSSVSMETKTHKHYPSTCSKCNAEIYTYSETSDTCIISEEHQCDKKDFDVSLTDSEMGLQSDIQASQARDTDKVGPENPDQSEAREEGGNVTDTSCLLDDKGDPMTGNIQNINENSVEQKDSAGHIETGVKGEGHIGGDKKGQGHVQEDTGDESASENTPEPTVHKKQGSNKLSMSLTKSGSFIDEKEARKYLAEQYEDKDILGKEEGDTDKQTDQTAQPSFLGNILSTVQSYPTDMMQQVSMVTSMTTKAFSNLADRFNFTEGQQESVDSKSDSGSLGSNPQLTVSDASEEDLHNTKPAAKTTSLVTMATEQDGASGSTSHLSETSFIEQNLPVLDDVFSSPERKPMSIRTIKMKQENLERRSSGSVSKSESDLDIKPSTRPAVTIETEVWAWGKNSSGQLGVGDQINRSFPTPVKLLDSVSVVTIRAGRNHSIALTADSHVYTWGENEWGQLGQADNTSKPSKIKLMSGCYIWDADAGDTYSVFLVDRAGFQPEVHYVGKHPCRDLYVPLYKTSRLSALPFLKQAGWIRSISAGGDNCAVLSCFSFSGFTGTLFEVSAIERRFYQHLNRIKRLLVAPLMKTSFYSALDVYPYKSAMQNLLTAFIKIVNMIGESSVEMTRRICRGDNFLEAEFFTNYSKFVDQFKRYSVNYADMVAIGGFEYFCKTGSSVFSKMDKVFSLLLEDSSLQKGGHSAKLQTILSRPFSHLKEYCRMAEKLSCNYPLDSDEFNMLNRVSLHWDSLRHTSSNSHTIAENTKKFWEHCNFPKLADAVKLPSRRLIRDSKTNPISLQGGGRMSTNNFYLFNDLFVHSQYSTFQSYPLETLWVEIPSNEEKKQNLIILTMPEEKLVLVARNPAEKAEWLMALNSTINKVLSSQKSVKRRGSTERLTPPDVRQATHGFLKHGSFKEATYSGNWVNGKLHGFGEMKWSDGRRYRGNFKNGLQHGYGKLTIKQDDGGERTQEGHWSEGHLHGMAKVRYSNGDTYDGYFKEGQRHGHGIYRKGQHTSSAASVYIGEWDSNKKQGYGIMDDVLKGEKYMGMWHEDIRHGGGIMVTLDGMYFEGNFVHDKLMGHGLMLTDDNSCYEGDFSGITQLSGKGKLTMPNGDYIEGSFTGSWNEGLKINGTFYKCQANLAEKRSSHSFSQISGIYGTMCVPAERRWERLFTQCCYVLGFKRPGQPNTKRAWDNVAVMLSVGKKNIRESEQGTTGKNRHQLSRAEDLEKIPPHSCGKMTIEYYLKIKLYLQKAFEVNFHPLGKLLDGLVDVFRAAYIGVGAHPRLLRHAVKEIKSYISRLYFCVRILFPDLPLNGGPQQIRSESATSVQTDSSDGVERQNSEEDEEYEVLSSGELLYPLLLPKIYPPLFDLYALYNDKEDEKYWERVKKLNKQGDVGLMAYLGVDQKFWLLDEKMFTQKGQSISGLRNHCFTSSVETLQQISTAFSPKEKLEVIKQTFLDITETVQSSIGQEHMWCMDELFPIFQYVVVRAQIRHLGAEIHLIQDLMERHLENGELGIMFTTLHACYFQIQNEKIPNH